MAVDEVVDRYLDTGIGDGALRAAGLRARLRVADRGVVLAVKGRGEVAPNGVTTRLELEGPATDDLDPSHWPPSAARDLVVDTIGDASLIEVAALRQVRHVRLMRRADTVVELSLDEVAALGPDGPAVATRDELEAELKAGSDTALAELAAALSVVDGVGPAFGSKLEFGLAARMER